MNSTHEITPLRVNEIGWMNFLQIWSDQIIKWIKSGGYNYDHKEMAMEALEVGYLGYPGATEAELTQAEARLGLQLPPSYRDFLKVSNGWRQIKLSVLDGRLFATHDIDLLRNKEPEFVEMWLNAMPEDYQDLRTPDEEYFYYGPDQDPGSMRDEYLATAIAVSEYVDADVYLLNPMIITAEGEWEAWRFGHKYPGARRYPSFRELMEDEYVRIMGIVARETQRHYAKVTPTLVN